jgi:5-methylcytosine-specific restriction endonuclease McrA
MPISKEKKKLYPGNWKEISKRIRFERAKNKCEFCGAENYKPHPITGSKVILTVAHLDHNPKNNNNENLKALCQKCHLTYDAKHHAENARKTRDKNLGIIRLPFTYDADAQ